MALPVHAQTQTQTQTQIPAQSQSQMQMQMQMAPKQNATTAHPVWPVEPVVLPGPTSALQQVELWPNLLTWPDQAGQYAPEQVALSLAQGQGARLLASDQSYGRWLPFPYWAGWQLHNPQSTAQTWLLSYVLPTQDHAAVWQQQAAGSWQVLPQWRPEGPSAWMGAHLWPVWQITLQAGETRRFLLRIDGYNRMRFPLEAVRSDSFARQHMFLLLGIGFVFAIPCVVLVYALTLWRTAEDRSIPLFVVMAICEMVGAAWVSGLITAVMPWVDRGMAGWLGWTGYIIVLGLSGWHARLFLATPKRWPWADRVLQGVSVFWLVLVPLAIAMKPEASRLTLLLGGVVHTLILSAYALRGLLQERSAHMALFLAVWLIYLGSGVLYILYRVLHLPVHYTLIGNYVQGALVAAFLGAAVTVQVVGKRKALQQQLHSARQRALLHASSQHDLMQPLQSLRLQSQQLSETSDATQRERLLGRMQSALNQVDDFLPALRQLWNENAPPTPQWQTLSVHTAIGEVVDDMRQVAQLKQLHLRYRPSQHSVRTDPLSLQRIVRNLLTNAVRYTPPGGDILLACRTREGQLWLLCWDTGLGMTPEQAKQCFEAFTRFDADQKAPEGLGLGLFSVRELARTLGVPTWLQSSPGRGTCIGVGLILASKNTDLD
ncbi:sensor histidine kinase [Limnohabitans sp.]|uniref:sensor histidine kinase n=1 Tax=Limnohabitans sp. TaxID=1907725 RepID=UPI0037BF1765